MANSSQTKHQSPLPGFLRKVPAKAKLEGETPRNWLASADLGPVITRAIAMSGMVPKEVAGEMGYADASALSRWMANVEPPNFVRLWTVKALRPWLLIALSEDAGEAVAVEHTVRVRRTA